MQNATMQRRGARGERGSRPNGNGSLRRAIGYLTKHRNVAVFAYGALIIAAIAQLAVPQLVQNMIDSITKGFVAGQILSLPALVQGPAALQAKTTVEQLRLDRLNAESLLIGAALTIVLFAVARGLFAFAQTFLGEQVSQSVAFDLRNEIFSKIQRLSFSYYDRNQTGQLMVRATSDVENVRLFVAQGLVLAVQGILLLVLTLAIQFATNWQLTLVVLPTLPIAMVVFGIFGAVVQPLFRKLLQKLSDMNTVLQESLAGIKVVKAFAREGYEQKRFDTAATDLLQQSISNAKRLSFLFPVIFTVAQIGQPLILYFGGQQILDGTLTLGGFNKFTLYLAYLFFPLFQLGFIIPLMAAAAASSQRIFEILDAKSDVTDKPDAIPMESIEGGVEFKDVTFRYLGTGDPVLKDVSFKAEPGQTIALLGATGSGKTTIINLIPRFYDVSQGAIMIDGHDIRDVKLESMRQQIGIVLQETNLFTGTIRDNIAFGRPEASQDEVVSAAKAAAAHDFIMSFPLGYETPVGERGTTLSGGQKQRIAIARALLLNPRLLILDDSTSSVDLTTEAKIQKALDNLMQGRTSFVIAQRITTVLKADQILVMEKGQIVAQGKHDDLMENSPIYAEIYHSQLVGDAEEQPDAEPMQMMEAK